MDVNKFIKKDSEDCYSVFFPNHRRLKTYIIESIFFQFGHVKYLSDTDDEDGYRFVQYTDYLGARSAVEGLEWSRDIRLCVPDAPRIPRKSIKDHSDKKSNNNHVDSTKRSHRNNRTASQTRAFDKSPKSRTTGELSSETGSNYKSLQRELPTEECLKADATLWQSEVCEHPLRQSSINSGKATGIVTKQVSQRSQINLVDNVTESGSSGTSSIVEKKNFQEGLDPEVCADGIQAIQLVDHSSDRSSSGISSSTENKHSKIRLENDTAASRGASSRSRSASVSSEEGAEYFPGKPFAENNKSNRLAFALRGPNGDTLRECYQDVAGIGMCKMILASEVIVGNIHADFSEAYFLYLFRQCQPLAIGRMQIVPKTMARYCHVYFKTPREAAEVERRFDQFNLSGKKLIVMRPSKLMLTSIISNPMRR